MGGEKKEFRMSLLADLLTPDALKGLATPANLRLGREIVDQNGVDRVETSPSKIVAMVGGVPSADQRRRVELAALDGLKWSCACTRRSHRLCKHAVAAALAIPR